MSRRGNCLDNAPMESVFAALKVERRFRTREEAKAILDAGQTYFDYVHRRVIKVDLSGDDFSPRLYDRDNGAGAAAAALEPLLAEARKE